MVVCPHCKSGRIESAKIPTDVVVVMPCPACRELCVIFRDKVIPLNRKIIEQGTMEERKMHLANVIAEFLEAGMFPPRGIEAMYSGRETPSEEKEETGAPQRETGPEEPMAPISKEEFDKFVRIDLKCIDNPAYFRRHFG